MPDDDLAKFLAGAKVHLAEAVTKAVNQAATGLRDQVRGQVSSHFKGGRLDRDPHSGGNDQRQGGLHGDPSSRGRSPRL